DADETAVLKALGANNTTTGYGKLKYLYYPTFHAVSLSDSNGNGTDLWKDIWKRLLNDTDYTNRYPLSTTITQPLASYAVSNVAAYDLFDSTGRSVTSGGKPDTFSDLLYGGDMNGTVYTLILDSAGANASVSVTPSCMVTRKTKKIPAGNPNAFRGARQPMTVTPVGALDKDGNLRVFFGTGKFDDMPADGADTAKMTFYALVENLKEPLYTGTGSDNTTRCSSGIESVPVSDFRFTHKCQEDNTTRTYYWTKLNAQNVSMPDGGACFPCMFDLPHVGERVIDSALVAGGYVFFTTFVPKSDYCSSGGDAYLYVLDYMCRPLTTNPVLEGGGVSLQFLNTQTQSWSSTKGKFVGAVQVSIGSGMPSRPVLDSSGTSVFVQTSDARMVRINVDLGPGGRSKVNGWTRVVE
ncbi:MAG TPA: hypothetical protein DCZ69_02475, partial [Syntrophobacteraceae bacterium]|nr:hypothetical protein [Syntrophobacteraceae bacterium]